MTSDETQIQILANWPMSHAKRVTRDNRKNPEYPYWAIRSLLYSRNTISQLLIIISFLVSKSLQVSSTFSRQSFMLQPNCLRANPSKRLGTSARFSLLRTQYCVTLQRVRDFTESAWHFTVYFTAYDRVFLLPDCQPCCLMNCDALPDFWFLLECCSWLYNLVVTPEFLQTRTLLENI